nr:MAG TPA: hypothetical protein [Bacteriophage sp.]
MKNKKARKYRLFRAETVGFEPLSAQIMKPSVLADL